MQNEQPQVQNNEMDAEAVAAAPANWMDIVRQHITGPVFSLAFHIFLLVLLGTLVIIAPNAVKDDIDPVQITEMEPVLPPPEEEPMPSDMTVMDTSSPNLDRYDSNEQQQMEEVGVTDVQIMTDIEIPTPLTIPDSNSALKLQGVLPFGRPGGGGKMGDGGEGDGRGNTKGMLQGVFYDLKQMRNRQKNDDFRADQWVGGWHIERVNPTLNIMKSFVNGSWQRQYDNEGKVHYPALDKYYSPPMRLWTSCFFSESINADEAPKAYDCDKEVNPAAWVCIYSGNVVAPFTGKFRFVGTADDVMFVRFNKEIVLDYGYASFSVGEYWTGSNDSNRQALASDSDRSIRNRSSLYSKQKLEVYNTSGSIGLAKGLPISIREGEIYPIEILISEIPGGSYYQALYIERLDDHNQPLDPNPDRMTLFRTTLDLPEQPKGNMFPQFNPYGPLFRVVPSRTASSGGGSGSGSGTLLGNRTTPRTARVNEDDDDLSL
ncbi:MAG: hypothetical protein J6Y92_08655 [Lentisphaeria bacterium]|nr:hypothetical protein [Lentisphaeria bacterium]